MLVGQQLQDVSAKLPADGAWEQKAALFEHATNLVLKIAPDPDQTSSSDKDGADELARFAPDLDFSIPSDPDQLSQAAGVVRVGLVESHRQSRMGMTGVDTYDRQIEPLELMPQPARHGACLKANAQSRWRALPDQSCKRARIRRRPPFEQDPAVVVQNANAGLLL